MSHLISRVRQIPALDMHQRYTVEEAAVYLRQSRTQTFADLKAGRLASFKVGSRRYVSGKAIAALSVGDNQ